MSWNNFLAVHVLRDLISCPCRHGKHPIRICSSERHNLTVESEGVQLGVIGRQTASQPPALVGHLVLCESVLHSKRLFMIMNESPVFV